jgi:hypothetical protein
MPADAIYVGRPTRWGNPYAIGAPHPDHGRPMTRDDIIELYEALIDHAPGATGPRAAGEIRAELAGRDLVCWCRADQRCHADVLLAVANGTRPPNRERPPSA